MRRLSRNWLKFSEKEPNGIHQRRTGTYEHNNETHGSSDAGG
jgi:hypothetical protein